MLRRCTCQVKSTPFCQWLLTYAYKGCDYPLGTCRLSIQRRLLPSIKMSTIATCFKWHDFYLFPFIFSWWIFLCHKPLLWIVSSLSYAWGSFSLSEGFLGHIAMAATFAASKPSYPFSIMVSSHISKKREKCIPSSLHCWFLILFQLSQCCTTSSRWGVLASEQVLCELSTLFMVPDNPLAVLASIRHPCNQLFLTNASEVIWSSMTQQHLSHSDAFLSFSLQCNTDFHIVMLRVLEQMSAYFTVLSHWSFHQILLQVHTSS